MTQDLSNPAEDQLLVPKSSQGTLPETAGSVVASQDRKGGVIWNESQGDRRRTEEALFAIESRFRKLSESGMLGIAIPDRFGGFHEGNDEFLRIVGYTREDLAAGLVRWDVMTPPEYGALDAEHIAEAAVRGSCTPYEKEYIRKDGSRVPILCGYALLEGSKDRHIGFIQDLTAQKEAEAGLREREARFRVLAESLPQFVWIRDPQGKYIYCNQRLLDYVGKPAEWLNTQAFDAVHPDDRATTLAKWQHSILTGEPYENEYRLLRYDGVYRCFLARAVPIRNEAGEVERWLGSTTDIHDQKLAEEALRRSEKLATAGRLAASMAHEINNPLSSVVNAVYLALKDPALSAETRALLEAADRELIRVSQFATQTLRFHKQSHAPTDADLGEIMDSVLSMYAPRVRTSSIELCREYRTPAKVLCYSSELRQVFANLIGNALDAMPSGGQLRVRIRDVVDAAEQAGIRITIADNGHGIPPHLEKRIFEPFVSTKETTGMGLGLWVSEEIIRKHRGRIAMRSSTSEHRHGTAFSLYFPLRTFKD
jgi:PAS domain S-box-containing protein